MTQWGKISWIFQMLMGIIVVFLFAAVFLPNFIKCRPSSREAEIKWNIHGIQIALERYYTDHGEYPAYLLGGDIEGWQSWHEDWDGYCDWEMADGRVASNAVLNDPLIELDYLARYPYNPFINTSKGREFRALVTSVGTDGSTTFDPRFGMSGNLMGMTLDDPNYFRGALQPEPSGWSEIETRRTLDRGNWMNVPEKFWNHDISGYYISGGRSERGSHECNMAFYPGTFFYRSLSSQEVEAADLNGRYGPSCGIRESPQHYIIGGFGGETTSGLDVIRLVPFNPDGELLSWQLPEDHADDVIYCGYGYPRGPGSSSGLPAVFGGGDAWTGPQFPPYDPTTGDVIYGAPDGIPDGVLVLERDVADMPPLR
jgi:hypothetical protein